MKCIPVIVLLMLLTSCVSNTVYKIVVPDLDFPKFPKADIMNENGDGTITVDEQWIVRLAEYSIRIEETEYNYKELKAFLEKENDK